ncbi:MAG: Trm112 family protein [Bryobacteraceae bacterium]
MRYSLLNFIACPETRSELICVVLAEKAAPIAHARFSECGRVNQEGAMVGPMPASAGQTRVTEVLRPLASEPAATARNYGFRIRDGLLIAPDTGRWYPIREFIPELLPDHLRNFDQDFAWLASRHPNCRLGCTIYCRIVTSFPTRVVPVKTSAFLTNRLR